MKNQTQIMQAIIKAVYRTQQFHEIRPTDIKPVAKVGRFDLKTKKMLWNRMIGSAVSLSLVADDLLDEQALKKLEDYDADMSDALNHWGTLKDQEFFDDDPEGYRKYVTDWYAWYQKRIEALYQKYMAIAENIE